MGMISNTARDLDARRAGLLLIITALVTALAVFGRVSSGADQPTLQGSLIAISDNSLLYSIGGLARAVSGITLILGAWYLLHTWIIRERLGTPIVPWSFLVSGLFTLISGVCAVVLAMVSGSAVGDGAVISGFIESFDDARWVTGKIGFTVAGLGLVVAARYQWQVGSALRYVAPVSLVVGIAMLFIWVDAATILHPITGAGFFIWLLIVGFMLFTGRVERYFADMYGIAGKN